MNYNEEALDIFLESVILDPNKREAIKKLYLAQLEHLVRDDVSADTINEVSGLNIPMIKGFNFLKNVGEEFKKNLSEIFEETKKEK